MDHKVGLLEVLIVIAQCKDVHDHFCIETFPMGLEFRPPSHFQNIYTCVKYVEPGLLEYIGPSTARLAMTKKISPRYRPHAYEQNPNQAQCKPALVIPVHEHPYIMSGANMLGYD